MGALAAAACMGNYKVVTIYLGHRAQQLATAQHSLLHARLEGSLGGREGGSLLDREGRREMQVQMRILTRERKKRTTERERKTGERRREPEKREDKRKAEGTREGVERK